MLRDPTPVGDSAAEHPLPAQMNAHPSLLESLSTCDALALSSLDVRRLTRQLRKVHGHRSVRMGFAGNVVLDPLAEFVEAHLACSGLLASLHVAPFGQPMQALLDPNSGLRQAQPNFLLLHLDTEALVSTLPVSRSIPSAEGRRHDMAVLFGQIEACVRAALENTAATVLVTNFVPPDCYSLGLADARAEIGEQALFSQLNTRLADTFRSEPRVQIVDLCRLTALHGRTRSRDRRLYYVAKLPWHESFLPLFADELVRHVNAALGRIRKCLVLDADNTLWDGVLGEDGPLGIGVGSGDPVSESHFDLQRRILSIKQRGVLLAMCSKNNPADVDELFRLREDMPLRRDDFACMEIGWDLKTEGLRRIAERLDIGTDSLVFLDDSVAEIELVRQMMPEVQCVLVPSDPALRPTCLDRLHSLDRAVLTIEDGEKTRQYQEQSVRTSLREQFANVHEYLRSLQTRITICIAADRMMTRAHQLFTKTNQFNVTTRRYSLPELQQLAAGPSSRLIMVRVQDRFGDLGWVGAVLLSHLDQPEAHIDSFILSCRAMGRGVETAILNHVKDWCFTSSTCEALTAEYLPTAKNAPAGELFEQHGFTLLDRSEGGRKSYRIDRDADRLTPCDWIDCELQDAPDRLREQHDRA